MGWWSKISDEDGNTVGKRYTEKTSGGRHKSTDFGITRDVLGDSHHNPDDVKSVTYHEADGTSKSYEGYEDIFGESHATDRKK